MRLFREEAPFVIGDPTEMPRPQAKKTEYVGTLSDGETRGYWLMLLATPYHGRAIPCGFVDYSSKTINQEATSRNQHHFAAFATGQGTVGEAAVGAGSGVQLPGIARKPGHRRGELRHSAESGRQISVTEKAIRLTLSVPKGETRILNKVFYKGKVLVNVIGVWKKGFSDPMWIMTNLDA